METKKELKFSQKLLRNIALFIALIILSILTGISFYWTLLIAVFWSLLSLDTRKSAYRTVSVAMKIIVVLFVLNYAIKAFFPKSYNSLTTTILSIDQIAEAISPSKVEVDARTLFDRQKEKESKVFIRHYDSLLKKGELHEAMDTLEKFEAKWTYKPKKSKSQEESVMVPDMVPDKVFSKKGTYQIEVKGETPFYIFIPDNGQITYSITSTDPDCLLIFSDGEVVKVNDNPVIRYRREPRFKIKANDIVALVIK